MHTTDRELLELAAKAAGIELDWDVPKNAAPWRMSEDGPEAQWHPLADDGDAFRLMVQLDLFSPCVVAQWQLRIKPEKYPDVAAEYRRAVVEVAAEIGKEMK